MPKLTDDNLVKGKLPTGSYGYSHTSLDELGATEYTLVTIVQDVSGSVSTYKTEMEKAIQEVVQSCVHSPRADNLMLRLVAFDDKLMEIHGFKLLENCNLTDYDNCLAIGGSTALYDASENAIMATSAYAKQLVDSDFDANAIVFVITDGEDNSSTMQRKHVKEALQKAMKEEVLESIVTVLIGVGTKDYPGLSDILDEFKNEAGLTQYVEIGNANAKTLAKLAEFVSKSISSQSQSLGTGSPSSQSGLADLLDL